ncbi:ABC transporter permease [Actinokineospora globicatena]|uniref:ABC transporter permease n=1 Tax=Actinokineospora globicatena TaxID=103729 RepID=UPI0020A23D40|nr:ABC-2 family transporter protein [Actinokineospora globicatena]MCP2302631.1 ABC-2 type transport system permease protein [Actinokineospora globicatena]GLW75681.1 ABC transporter permease [Actinokineospora globicatena]GLW82522.1 ABC transporter permease [Actinokineospora globicatena]
MARVQAALVAAGFRRYATYRQATFAGAFTNTVFGFLRCYILLSVAATAGGVMAGYTGPQLASYVWLGQGLLAVVNSWTMLDLAERVRTGDVVADLLRPVDPLWTYLWTDLGRAVYAVLTRFLAPLVVGAVAFGLYVPQSLLTYPLFALSTLLAIVVCFACRYLIGLTAFWLLDIRGVMMFWVFVSGAASGLYFPLAILPDWLATVLWVATPFPSLLQAPLDVIVERGGTGHALLVCLGQVVWTVLLLLACRVAQASAVRKLVVQGG